MDVLKTAQAFKSEIDYTVWSDLAANLKVISTVTEYTDYHDLYMKYCQELFSDVANRMGWQKKEAESECAAA